METGTPGSWETKCDDSITRRKPKKGNYKVAIFLPNGWFDNTGVPTYDSRMQAVAELVRWCEQRGMPYIVLYRGACTWLNFATVLSNPSVKYVYMVAHGNYVVKRYKDDPDAANRMYFVVSGFLGFGTEKVVSYKGDLPGNMDASWRVHSMQSLGLYQTPRIRLVYMTVCHLGQEYNDQMARQWLDYSFDYPINQLFCGWQNECYNTQYWKEWDYDFWHYIGSGDNNAWWVYTRIQLPDENLFGPEIAEEFQMFGDNQVRFNP